MESRGIPPILDQQVTMSLVPQLLPARRVVGYELADRAPEALRVIHLDKVRDLVRHDVIEEAHWHLDQPPVEMDAATRVAASPSGAGARELNLRARLHAEHAPVVVDALAEARQRLRVQPFVNVTPDGCGPAHGRAHHELRRLEAHDV